MFNCMKTEYQPYRLLCCGDSFHTARTTGNSKSLPWNTFTGFKFFYWINEWWWGHYRTFETITVSQDEKNPSFLYRLSTSVKVYSHSYAFLLLWHSKPCSLCSDFCFCLQDGLQMEIALADFRTFPVQSNGSVASSVTQPVHLRRWLEDMRQGDPSKQQGGRSNIRRCLQRTSWARPWEVPKYYDH